MSIQDIKDMLGLHSHASRGWPLQEMIYLRGGHGFSNEPLSRRDHADVQRLVGGVHAFRTGECYMNAGMLALTRDEFTFVEGYAMGLWPVPHAWVAYKGRAIDVTWPITWDETKLKLFKPTDDGAEIIKRVEANIANCDYFGIEIPARVLRRHVLKHRAWMPVFDHRLVAARRKQALTRGSHSATIRPR